MYIPVVRERVRLLGRSGEFLVLRADYSRQVADLAGVDQACLEEKDVPFASIFAAFEQTEAERRPPQPEHPSRTQAKLRLRAGN